MSSFPPSAPATHSSRLSLLPCSHLAAALPLQREREGAPLAAPRLHRRARRRQPPARTLHAHAHAVRAVPGSRHHAHADQQGNRPFTVVAQRQRLEARMTNVHHYMMYLHCLSGFSRLHSELSGLRLIPDRAPRVLAHTCAQQRPLLPGHKYLERSGALHCVHPIPPWTTTPG